MWDLIVSVPDHCLSFYLAVSKIASTPTAFTSTPSNYQINIRKANMLNVV